MTVLGKILYSFLSTNYLCVLKSSKIKVELDSKGKVKGDYVKKNYITYHTTFNKTTSGKYEET